MFGRWLALLLVLAAAGCGGGGGGGGTSAGQAAATSAALAIDGLAPAQVAPGARVALTGSALDRVQAASLNSVALTIVSRAATRLELDVPLQARSGFIEVVADDGSRYRSPQTLVVAVPQPEITSLVPTSLLWGASLRISGSALAQAGSVVFAGDVAATAKAIGDDVLEVIVPDNARSGFVTVLMADGARLQAPYAIEVIEPIRVDAQAVYRSAAADRTLSIAGRGLAGVTAVTIGASPAAIAARSNTQLTVVVPPTVTCGAITLLALNQPAAAAGLWRGGDGCGLRLAAVEFAQVLSQASEDPYQRLVPGRGAWVRALVVAEAPAQSSPSVQLRAAVAGVTLGSLALSGPSTLPQLAAGEDVPAALRYDSKQGFAALLPPEWVRPGLEVTIEIDGEARFGPPLTSLQRPQVGTETAMDVVLVPLVSGAHAPQLPSVAEVLDEFERRFPVARTNLRVSMRAPYTLATVDNGVIEQTDWSAALRELEQLRRTEAPARVYYGLVKPVQQLAATEGLGYVNAAGMASPSLSALGLDRSRGRWASILAHELGHLFGRPHAPCGIAGDTAFPYANGALGSTAMFDVFLAQLLSPVGQTDLMGYCGGEWFSDYNYRHVQTFLETLRPSVSVAQQLRADADAILVSGVITPAGVRVATARVQRSAPVGTRGAYRLRIETANGVLEVPFDASGVDHVLDELHFFVTVPDPGPIVRLQVLQGERLLPALAGSALPGPGQAAATSPNRR